MTVETTDQIAYRHARTAGQADMRGRINTIGIEDAAEIVADFYAAPGNDVEHARLRGIIIAAFEAGQLHQLNVGSRNA
jgi:hypothetical protein